MHPSTLAAFRDELEQIVKVAWSWEGFKEGLVDEGIPLAGATIGAALTKNPHNALRNAAMGYAGGGLASLGAGMLTARKKDKQMSTAKRILGAGALGYGLGGLSHFGAQHLTEGIPAAATGIRGALRSAFHGSNPHLIHGVEEAMPAMGAVLGTSIGLATAPEKNRQQGRL